MIRKRRCTVQNFNNMRHYLTKWNQLTYRQGLDNCYAIKKDAKVYNTTLQVLEKQSLEHKKMNGYSVKNIPIKNEGKIDIIFSEIFWELFKSYISPANYIASIVKACLDNNISNSDEIAGIVGRGLRAFPSFLRELDLTCKIIKYFSDAKIINSPTQDVQEHTDILIENNNCDYRIWSYQNFERGLVNTASRLKGNRGTIPDGIHVLCPIDIGNEFEREEIEGWYFYSERYVNYLCEMIIIEKPDDYCSISRMDEYAIKIYLRKANTIKK